MKAIDVIKKLCRCDSVVIRIWNYDERFECCHSAETWVEAYEKTVKELLDKEVDYMYIEDAKLIIDVGD